MRIALSVSQKEKPKGSRSPYVRALVAAGARESELELLTAGDHVRADDLDGVVFTGGEDVDPARYGEATKYDSVQVDRARDDFELTLLKRAIDRRLPILGICRGAQMINVGFGGTLYQDLAEDAEPRFEHRQTADGKARNDTTHTVTVSEPDSVLAGAIHGSCRVNSIHHQAIKRTGRGLKVTAYSEDGLVEAVEAAEDYPFLVAVQWHPEEIVDQAEQRHILSDFLRHCRETAERTAHGAGLGSRASAGLGTKD